MIVIDSSPSSVMNTSTVSDNGVNFVPQRFHVIHTAPVWMTMSERVLMYALVAGLQPERILEIGTYQGGSTMIMCAALDDLGSSGRIVCVDPDPRIEPENLKTFQHRATLVAEPSPEALTRASEIAGGGFEFALIDGDHSYEGVVRDIEATLPTLADEAHIVFHDAHFSLVRTAIDEAVRGSNGQLDDAGLVSAGSTPAPPEPDGTPVEWGGLRLLRFRRSR
jgi:predicted O-methyltransferase YrrM